MALAEVERDVFINVDKINILRYDRTSPTIAATVQIVTDGGVHSCRQGTTMENVVEAIKKAKASEKSWFERTLEDAMSTVETEKDKGERY